MKMTKQPTKLVWSDDIGNMITIPNTDASNCQGNCDRCGTLILRFRGQGDLQCSDCHANYNCGGQRLRDDLHTRINRSSLDEDMGDLEGDELSYLAHEGNDW